MKRLYLCFSIILFLIMLTGCEPVALGNSASGYKTIPDAKIQPIDAVKIAQPYLDKTFELRSKSSTLERDKENEPTIFVTLKDDFYYIVKENYPAKSIYFYLAHAVRVHKDTGEIIPPE